jgi:lycopene cyclase domain-containing protein
MRQLTYLAVLGGCLLGTLPLELMLRVGVYSRWRRLVAALAPGVVLGVAWDQYAVRHGHWHFDHRYLIGLDLAGLPLEEVLFFVVIPTCAILTLEAVRRRRPCWLIGDEPAEPATADPAAGPTAAGPDRPAR